jgi:DNA-directed RNA polymerase subunit beta
MRSTEIRETSERTTKNIPNLSSSEIKHLNDDGIVTVGTFVRPGDILVGKVISNNTSEQLPESSYYELFWSKGKRS